MRVQTTNNFKFKQRNRRKVKKSGELKKLQIWKCTRNSLHLSRLSTNLLAEH
jgi:hypothetical protein